LPELFLSPAWSASGLSRANLARATRLALENPPWRLSIQQHKVWGIP
jgi:hypothetical protein